MQKSNICQNRDSILKEIQNQEIQQTFNKDSALMQEIFDNLTLVVDAQWFLQKYILQNQNGVVSYEYKFDKIQNLQLIKMIGYDQIQNLSKERGLQIQYVYQSFEYFDILLNRQKYSNIQKNDIQDLALIAFEFSDQIKNSSTLQDISFQDFEEDFQKKYFNLIQYLKNYLKIKVRNYQIYDLIAYTSILCNLNTKQFQRVQKMIPIALTITISLVLIVTKFSDKNTKLLQEIMTFRAVDVQSFAKEFYNLFRCYLDLPLYSIYNNQF